jgi:hypothetical protein
MRLVPPICNDGEDEEKEEAPRFDPEIAFPGLRPGDKRFFFFDDDDDDADVFDTAERRLSIMIDPMKHVTSVWCSVINLTQARRRG